MSKKYRRVGSERTEDGGSAIAIIDDCPHCGRYLNLTLYAKNWGAPESVEKIRCKCGKTYELRLVPQEEIN